MKAIADFDKVSEVTERKSVPAGGYVCVVTAVQDVPDKEYLKVEFDVAEGEYKGYGLDMMEKHGFNPLKMVKSYKESAKGFFKRFISSIERSNGGYTWNWDEYSLIGKRFGAVLGEEQYRKNSGDIGTRLYCDREMPVQRIKDGDFDVPALKTLPGHAPADKANLHPVQLSDKELEDLF